MPKATHSPLQKRQYAYYGLGRNAVGNGCDP
jgi:hypothetical protein